MEQGTVKWFNNEKGYGFIKRDEGMELFVHYRSIDMEGFKKLKTGELVDFEVQETPRGIQAVNVKKHLEL
jgi:cold shock protein